MPMTVLLARNASDKIRGFLASVMLEVSPCVYAHPTLTHGVRERVWNVLLGWVLPSQDMSVVLLWRDKGAPGGMGVLKLGEPPLRIVDYEGFLLSCRETEQGAS